VLCQLTAPLPAHADDRPHIVVSEPEGFSNLTEEQAVLVDVFFGGLRIGEAQVVAVPGFVSFADPQAVVALLPELTNRSQVEAELGAHRLPAHSELACSQGSDRKQCGRLTPSTVGLIYDRQKFRIDIFLNPQLLSVPEVAREQYLAAPQGGVSLINALGLVVAGQSGTPQAYHSVFDQIVLAEGDKRLRADLSHATNVGFGADYLAFEWDRPGLRYSLGAMWAPGSEFTGRRKLIGAGIESQIDTRLDKDTMRGSAIVVYLGERARVDVLQSGRVINSAIYEAGNQKIDTANLPDGSYDIVLRIQEPGRQAREERRYFSKSRQIPSLGRTEFFGFAGTLVNQWGRESIAPSRHPYAQAGVSHRLSEHWALAGTVEATDEGASAELAATWLTPAAQVRAALLVDSQGTYGGILQLASAGNSRLNYNFDLRKIEQSTSAESVAFLFENEGASAVAGGRFGFAFPVRGYSQLGGLVSYNFANVRLLGTAYFREGEEEDRRYSLGPAIEWDFLRRGQLTLAMRGEMVATDRGESAFAGISLRLLGARSSVSALSGARASSISDDDHGEGAIAAIAGSWNQPFAGGELAVGAGLELAPRRTNASLSGDLNHPLGSISGDLVRAGGPAAASTQYSMGFHTTVAAGGGGIRVAGRSTTQSLIIARVEGARSGDRFDVLVNEQLAGQINGAGMLDLTLPSYRNYSVRIRPVGGELLAYDSSSRQVALYPGSVSRLEWAARPIIIKIGRLTFADGTPVGGASITGQGVWNETDPAGYFQIEVSEGADLTVSLADGTSYPLELPSIEANTEAVRVGTVICCQRRDVRLGANTP
jgi:hypothetical protein